MYLKKVTSSFFIPYVIPNREGSSLFFLYILSEKKMRKKTYALADSFAELDEVISLAREANQLTSMLKAIELKGKLAGLYEDAKKNENEPDIAQILVKFVDNLEERYEKNKRQVKDQMCRNGEDLCAADDRAETD